MERSSLKGATVSIDAIARNATAIRAAGANYLLAVKSNQPILQTAIEDHFNTTSAGVLDTATDWDKRQTQPSAFMELVSRAILPPTGCEAAAPSVAGKCMHAEKLVQRWVTEGVVDTATAGRILAFEAGRKRFDFGNMIVGLAGLAIVLGVAAMIGVNWDRVPAALKIGGHATVNGIVAFGVFRFIQRGRRQTIWFDLLLGLLAGLTFTFIALIGQLYQTQDPIWKALAFWLAITTPFWLGLTESRNLIRLWLVSFLVTYGFFVFQGIADDHEQTRGLLVTLLPFGMIALGQNAFLRNRRDVTLREISLAGFLIIALLTSCAQISWSLDDALEPASRIVVWHLLEASGVAALGLVLLRRFGWLKAMPAAVDVFLLTSVVFGAGPFLVPHHDWVVVGAVMIMAYWALCGWVGVQAGFRPALRLATIFIALRLVGVYVEVFGSLLMTGAGLIVSGVLLIALVWGTRRLLAILGRFAAEKRS